ncbi:hypothetical protein [Actinokineospora enzanensis]|nr:hypothetical protein [Actinokineospora enzanensis]
MNEILDLQNLPVENADEELGLLATSGVSVRCTSGKTLFAPIAE